MKKLVAAYIGDGYLYGASDAPHAFSPDYWALDEGEAFELVELVGVPDDLARRLLAHGTTEQDFSDGYEAARAAEPYRGEVVYSHEPPDRGVLVSVRPGGSIITLVFRRDNGTIVLAHGDANPTFRTLEDLGFPRCLGKTFEFRRAAWGGLEWLRPAY